MSVIQGTIETKSIKLRVGCFGWVDRTRWGSDIAPDEWLIRKSGERCLGCVQGPDTSIVPCNQLLETWTAAKRAATKCSACRQWRNKKKRKANPGLLQLTQCDCSAGCAPGRCHDCAPGEPEALKLKVCDRKKRQRLANNGLLPCSERKSKAQPSVVNVNIWGV